ncbi:MAG: GNAT family protein, partial [Oscillospiraceae bacterium]
TITGDEKVMVASGVKPCESYMDSCKRLRKVIEKDISMAIVLKKTDRIIGTITFQPDLHRMNKRSAMLGYELAYDYWGRGYMAQAVEIALGYAFDRQKLMIVSVSHFIQNERSRRVIEKVGFTYEGTLRQEFVRFDNRVFDSMVYSMTREEYDQKYRTISYDDVRIY